MLQGAAKILSGEDVAQAPSANLVDSKPVTQQNQLLQAAINSVAVKANNNPLESSMTSAEHVQNLLQSKFRPKLRIVQKSKFANKIGEEISDENSIEKGSQLRQLTDEEESLISKQKDGTSSNVGRSDFDENNKNSLL